jgi:hypothetical protein
MISTTTMKLAARKNSGLVADIAELLRNLANALFDSYRPELHYMRGPGPKWHAKHDLSRAAKAVAAPMLISARAGDALTVPVLIHAVRPACALKGRLRSTARLRRDHGRDAGQL